MTILAGRLVQAKKLDLLVAAVRAAYASIGAVEGEGTRVVIGAPIYINVAAVCLELGDRDGMQAALEAMKRNKMRAELKKLPAEPLFVKATIE